MTVHTLIEKGKVEFVRETDSGKLLEIRVDGKKVKAGYVRGWRKAEKTPYFHLFKTPQVAQNPFTGVQVQLTAIEATIYRFCVEWYARYSYGRMDVPIQTYDDMKYFLLDLNPSAYYDLLD
jgi:hypothetical protein